MITARHALCSMLFVAVMGLSAAAQAGPKPWYWSWWPSHWDNMTGEPYLEGAKHPQINQWAQKGWEPADWAAQRPNSSLQLVQGFYTANILRGQDVWDDVPVLLVGPNFYHLSGEDKRRVVATVDHYYQITNRKLNGMFTIADGRTKQPIGLYTAHGLQLQ